MAGETLLKAGRTLLDDQKVNFFQAGQFEEHGSAVWRVCWNVTGTIIASSGDDGCVKLWKARMAWKTNIYFEIICLFRQTTWMHGSVWPHCEVMVKQLQRLCLQVLESRASPSCQCLRTRPTGTESLWWVTLDLKPSWKSDVSHCCQLSWEVEHQVLFSKQSGIEAWHLKLESSAGIAVM